MEHTIKDFHDNNVYRDEEGHIWVPQDLLVATVRELAELNAKIDRVRVVTYTDLAPIEDEWDEGYISCARAVKEILED